MTEPPYLPLTPSNVRNAYDLVKPYIHRTPLLTSTTLNRIASRPFSSENDEQQPAREHTSAPPARPVFRFYFKCENLQRIGAFKVRGAFHALLRLISERGLEVVRQRGVITHSSGNHAQALSLAAKTLDVPAYIVMPTISTPSKIEGTRTLGAKIVFSGSTSVEREATTARLQEETGAILVPPYDHPDIILGQGTVGLEIEEQFRDLALSRGVDLDGEFPSLDAVITPVGGGGLNSGVTTYFSIEDERDGTINGTSTQRKKTKVFGAEPSFEGADDACRGLAAGKRIETVSTKTIADGLRTPVGVHPWSVISDPKKHSGVYSVTEDQIKAAMKLVLERMKVVVEPSAVVGLAVCLYNEEFRRMVEHEAGERGWDIGIVFSGGNTTVEAISKLFA